MSRELDLVLVTGPFSGRRYKVGPGGLRLGRSSSNDISVPDEALSRNHCLFEPIEEGVLRVTDLASANGTYVNGETLGGNAISVRPGDTVEVGATTIKVVFSGEEPSANATPVSIDLGFKSESAPPEKSVRKSRSPLVNILWGVAVLTVVVAAFLFLSGERKAPPPPPVSTPSAPVLREAYYEKVEADAESIFRYELTLSRDGMLRVVLDDVPKANRHAAKSRTLGPEALQTLGEILAYNKVKALGGDVAGPEPDTPRHNSETLRVVYADRAWSVRIVDVPEPEAFREIRTRLETFSKNELGVWAIQYSREKLVSLAEESLAAARAKFEDRDVNYGNLAAAVASYREAIFYLETVNPKPPCHAAASAGLDAAVSELDRRASEQRFRANRACNLGQWAEAQRELSILVEMVPDRADERNREAMAKLLDVEKRTKKGNK